MYVLVYLDYLQSETDAQVVSGAELLCTVHTYSESEARPLAAMYTNGLSLLPPCLIST